MASEATSELIRNQAPTTWKIAAYAVLIPAVGLGVYGMARFLIASFILAQSTDTSLYQLICLPASIFTTPFITIGLPLFLLRDATRSAARNYIIVGVFLLALAVNVIVFAPEWSSVLWGITL